MLSKFKIVFFTIFFTLISCTVDVNQPVKVEEVYTINAKNMFDSLVNHIGWRTTHSRFAKRWSPAEGEVPYVELSIISVWKFTDNAILDDLKGKYKFNVYIQRGQEDNINDAALSNNHRIGSEKKVYWTNGAWAIQNVTGHLSFVYSRTAGGTWNTDDRKFNPLQPSFNSGEIIVFENNLNLLNLDYKLTPLEEKEEIINAVHVDHN